MKLTVVYFFSDHRLIMALMIAQLTGKSVFQFLSSF